MLKISWQYCKNPNEINAAIDANNNGEYTDWEKLYSAQQIISIDITHNGYQVFWRVDE